MTENIKFLSGGVLLDEIQTFDKNPKIKSNTLQQKYID